MAGPVTEASEREVIEALVEHAPGPVARFDRALRHTYVNACGARVYGLAPEAVVGRSLAEVGVPPAVATRFGGELERAFEEGDQRTVEVDLVSPALGPRVFSALLIPERRGPSEVTAVLAVLRDETDLRRAERARRSSEARFRSVFEQAAIGMGIVRFDDARWTEVNDALCRMLGRTREEMRRTPWPEITHPDDVDVDLVPFRRMSRGEIDSYSVEKRFRHRNGTYAWARLTLSLVRDASGAPDYEIAIVEAIDDRKRAEAALREGEARFRDLADNIAQLAWMADECGRPFWYNRRMLDYTGTTTVELRRAGLLSRGHPDHVDRVARELRRCIDVGVPWEDTFPLRGADGSYRWFLARAIPLRDFAGVVHRWFGTATDVTELRRAQAELEAEGRRKSEFLAVLSHELRNPLTPIRNSVWILARAAPGGEAARRALAVIDRQVAHMVRLVDDLLDVTRIARGKVRLRREPVALDEVVRATADDLRAPFRGEGIDFDIDLPDLPVPVLVDRTRIAQVVSNLLQNALKFTPAGGRVSLSLEPGGAGEAVLRVRDTGVGIEPRLLERLFEPFVQGDETIDRSKGGLGLGLALAKGLVELHGGRIAAHSAGPGTGTEITVTLPLDARGDRDAA